MLSLENAQSCSRSVIPLSIYILHSLSSAMLSGINQGVFHLEVMFKPTNIFHVSS